MKVPAILLTFLQCVLAASIEAQCEDFAGTDLLKAVETQRTRTSPMTISYEYWEQGLLVYREVFVELEPERGRYRITATPVRGPKEISIFDGKELLTWNGWDSGTISDRNCPPLGFSFDPLAIGLVPLYKSNLTLAKQIDHRAAVEIHVKSRELIETVPTYVVHRAVRFGETNTYWIQPSRGYRVVRFEKEMRFDDEGTERVIHHRAESRFFDELNGSLGWVPREVVITGFSNGKPISKRELRHGQVERVAPFPEEIWMLRGLKLPIGAPVVDFRVKRRIGYWNADGRLTEHPPKASAAALH